MTAEPPKKKAEPSPRLGASGEAVRINVRRLRDTQGISAAELSRRLGQLDRAIPLVGIQRIEAGTRRVDADDLMALAAALGVSPITLLMPANVKPDDLVTITGEETAVPAAQVWAWLTAADALNTPDVLRVIGPQLRYGHFGQLAWPDWVREDEMKRNREELRKLLESGRGDD